MDGDEGNPTSRREAVDAPRADSTARLTSEESECDGLPPRSRAALEQIAASYVTRVLEEAGRLEAAHNQGGNEPMITPTHITDADMLLRRGYVAPVSPRFNAWKAASYVIAIVCGVFVNNITEPWGAIGVVLMVIAGLVTYSRGEGQK